MSWRIYGHGLHNSTIRRAAVVTYQQMAISSTILLPGLSSESNTIRIASPRGIERCFDVPFVAELALREKQVQQNYRPVIAVHKWFARRPGTLFRALLLAEFAGGSLREQFYRSHSFSGLKVADPFMGGGTPLLEANRLGFDITGLDINPMSYWIVRQEIAHLDLAAYRQAAETIWHHLEKQVGHLYRTQCTKCGRLGAQVKYFIWVKIQSCQNCGQDFDLFPGYLLAENRRHPKNVIICAACGALAEVEERQNPGLCTACGQPLVLQGPARRNRCPCPHCGFQNTYPPESAGPPRHRLVALEYHCWHCKPGLTGRFFKKPDQDDLDRYQEAVTTWQRLQPRFVPEDPIPPGDETQRLHRWGYRRYREMFNARQLLGLELIARAITDQPDRRLQEALATNLSDLLRYQNMLCRYDTMALKSLDIFSIHGYPVSLIQCESNLLGIRHPETGLNIGSGGWSNIVEKFIRAKEYCEHPFEIRYQGGRKMLVPIRGEWIGESNGTPTRQIDLRCASATRVVLPPASLDMVLTDPPYFANVQYAELMDFCYVWLRRLIDTADPAFSSPSTRHADELTGNDTLDKGLEHFTAGLAEAFRRMTRALKPGSPFVFTYHHNTLEAYLPVAVALLDAGLVCTASLPCPGEMGGSIHIRGTESSVVDTVFVCRTTGTVRRRWLVKKAEEIAALVTKDLQDLREGGVRVTRGDARCVAYGHLIRLAVWHLRHGWNLSATWTEKLACVRRAIAEMGGFEAIEPYLAEDITKSSRKAGWIREEAAPYLAESDDEVPF